MTTIADKVRAALAGGVQRTLAELAELTGLPRAQISGQLHSGAKTGEYRKHDRDEGPTTHSLNPNHAPRRKRGATSASRAPVQGHAPRRTAQPLQPAPRHTGDSRERPAPAPPLALPPADELRCAIFHDATIVIDKAGTAMTLEPHECARLAEFLGQMEAIWQERIKPRRKEARA